MGIQVTNVEGSCCRVVRLFLYMLLSGGQLYTFKRQSRGICERWGHLGISRQGQRAVWGDEMERGSFFFSSIQQMSTVKSFRYSQHRVHKLNLNWTFRSDWCCVFYPNYKDWCFEEREPSCWKRTTRSTSVETLLRRLSAPADREVYQKMTTAPTRNGDDAPMKDMPAIKSSTWGQFLT